MNLKNGFKNIYQSLTSMLGSSNSKELIKLQAELNFLDTSIKMNDGLLSRIEQITPSDVERNYLEVVRLRDSIRNWHTSITDFYKD